MSPGGSTPSSSRSWPELPPLSNIVTTAFSVQPGIVLQAAEQAGQTGAAAEAADVQLAQTHSLHCTAADCCQLAWHLVSTSNCDEHVEWTMPTPCGTLERDLRGIFGSRLQSLVVYGSARTRGHGRRARHGTTPRRRRRSRSWSR